MTTEIRLPYPEAEQKQEDSYLKAEYAKLLERERIAAENELNAKLDSIAQGNDATTLKSDLSLRIKFVERHGWQAFSDLNRKHLAQQRKQRVEAELAEKQTKRSISTSQGRIALLNKSRKAR